MKVREINWKINNNNNVQSSEDCLNGSRSSPRFLRYKTLFVINCSEEFRAIISQMLLYSYLHLEFQRSHLVTRRALPLRCRLSRFMHLPVIRFVMSGGTWSVLSLWSQFALKHLTEIRLVSAAPSNIYGFLASSSSERASVLFLVFYRQNCDTNGKGHFENMQTRVCP